MFQGDTFKCHIFSLEQILLFKFRILEGMVAYGRLLLAPVEGWWPSARGGYISYQGNIDMKRKKLIHH